MDCLEARVGIEPTNEGFADLSLTTWLPRLRVWALFKHSATRHSGSILSTTRQPCTPVWVTQSLCRFASPYPNETLWNETFAALDRTGTQNQKFASPGTDRPTAESERGIFCCQGPVG